jgi:site-specific DNA-methyltransferase (cytosine-N4-specific)
MENIIQIETSSLEVHPLAAAVKCQTKNSTGVLEFMMKEFGQATPITAVVRNNKYLIIDGIERWGIAKNHPDKYPTLDCKIIDLKDDEVIDRRIALNSQRKISIREKCMLVENVLGILGKRAGVKREIIDALEEKYSSKVKLDRYHFACHIADTDCSASTLRKLMTIYNSEEEQKEKLLDLVDSGQISIEKAFKVLNSKKKKIEDSKMLRLHHFGDGRKGQFELYCKSALNMSEIDDESIPLFIFSPPYWILRKYRNQGINPFGWEESVEEYIENLMMFIREIRKKLKKNGVMVIILGETYRDGYAGVCTKAETAIEKDGWKIKDVNIWVKKNPKFAPHPSRFTNGYERIIVACPSDEEPVFNPIKKPSAIGEFRVIPSSELVNGNRNFSMASPEADITNVITTGVFNKKEHSDIDEEFTHDAPAPEQIYETFIKAYSMPGDTIVDNFVGSGTVGVGLKLGRNVIGYDIDPASIDFCQKRFKAILGEDVETLSIAA